MNKKEEGFIPTKTQEQTEHCSVLIVGGGLVGSSAAVFLTQKGVSVLLIEKHAGSSPHPRAIGFTQRTLELFRSVGLADSIPQVHGSKKMSEGSGSKAWQENGLKNRPGLVFRKKIQI